MPMFDIVLKRKINIKIKEPLTCWFNKSFECDEQKTSKKEKQIGQLQGVYLADIPSELEDQLAYVVKLEAPDKEAVAGTLQFGVSYIQPYQINGECSCTKGHFHANQEYDEYYFGYEGEGYLLFWDGKEDWFVQKVFPGSVHHIDGKYAHRLVNTSQDKVLKVGACWNALAGYDYGSIEKTGFPVRIFLEDN